MEREPPEVTFFRGVMLVNHVCFVAYIGGALWRFGSFCKGCVLGEERSAGGCRAVKTWLQQVRARALQNSSADTLRGFHAAKVQGLVSQRRVARSMVFARHGVHFIALYALMTNMMFGYSAFTDSWAEGQDLRRLPDSMVVDLTLAFLISLYMRALPRRTGPITMDVFHAAFVARAGWQSQTSLAAITGSSPRESIYIVYRLCCAMLMGNPGFTVVLNVALAAVRVYFYIEGCARPLPTDDDPPVNVYKDYGGSGTVMFAATEFFVACAAVLASWTLEDATSQEVFATLQARASSRAEETISALLAMLCDAVVPTTLDFMLTSPSTSLAGFLLRSPPNNTYEGSNLMQFISAEDREHVSEQLSSCPEVAGTTVSVLGRAVDGAGTQFAVRMYCTRFTDAKDRDGFLIGILDARREDDCGSARAPPDSFDADSAALALAARTGSTTLACLSEGDASWSQPSSVATSEASSRHIVESSAVGAMQAWLDISRKGWPIQRATSAFMSLGGPNNTGSLEDWVNKQDVQKVNARIQDLLKEVKAMRAEDPRVDDEELPVARLNNFWLQPELAKKCCYSYVCEGLMDMILTETDLDGAVIVRLTVSSVTVKMTRQTQKESDKQKKKDRAFRKKQRRQLEERAIASAASPLPAADLQEVTTFGRGMDAQEETQDDGVDDGETETLTADAECGNDKKMIVLQL
eukprot:TRINITY_DN22036_c0_g1_i2.p1 TRINITY_DN22036_c0_g1~~TRINITY_DN22036_c0_g1_i2.p1  ORF type:complete len:694 (-),score=115.22 TRINITY_DN22036_c0_g1_i2:177-2258(-)